MMSSNLYGDETDLIDWIGTKVPVRFLNYVRSRHVSHANCHVWRDGFKAAEVVFRPNSEADILIRFNADRRDIESLDGHDLLVCGNCAAAGHMGISFGDYFSNLEFDQSTDRFFVWGRELTSALVSRIADEVFNRLIRKSVYWEPIDSTYAEAGIVPCCQYMEWEESCGETKNRQRSLTMEILAEDCDGNIRPYAYSNDVYSYMWARKLVADSYGADMFIVNDERKLVVAERKRFRAEWHPDAMFGDFEFTVNPDFTKGLKFP